MAACRTCYEVIATANQAIMHAIESPRCVPTGLRNMAQVEAQARARPGDTPKATVAMVYPMLFRMRHVKHAASQRTCKLHVRVEYHQASATQLLGCNCTRTY